MRPLYKGQPFPCREFDCLYRLFSIVKDYFVPFMLAVVKGHVTFGIPLYGGSTVPKTIDKLIFVLENRYIRSRSQRNPSEVTKSIGQSAL